MFDSNMLKNRGGIDSYHSQTDAELYRSTAISHLPLQYIASLSFIGKSFFCVIWIHFCHKYVSLRDYFLLQLSLLSIPMYFMSYLIFYTKQFVDKYSLTVPFY